jgi:hypothetical protein
VREIGHHALMPTSGFRNPTPAAIASTLLVAAVVILIVGVAWSSTNAASSRPNATPSQAFACAPNQQDCTSQQVIATVRRLLEAAGATATEAACMAAITGQGKHSVTLAIEGFPIGRRPDAIRCVGSERRFHDLVFRIPPVWG